MTTDTVPQTVLFPDLFDKPLVATFDLVQDVLQHTFARLTWFESTHVSALRAYLRRAVENRVQGRSPRRYRSRCRPST